MTLIETQLDQCVGCGLCLSSCPTYQITRREEHGPRGRIAAMRLVHIDPALADDETYLSSMATCVQCRACEPACPSGVQFGRLIEHARADMHEAAERSSSSGSPRAWQRALTELGLRLLTSRAWLRLASVGLAALQALQLDRLLPARLRVARRVTVRGVFARLRPQSGDPTVFLFRGCVMDAWFSSVHAATVRVLASSGLGVEVEPAPACCGAIHLHAGRLDQARALAREVIDAYAGTTGMIVVNSAGCGAALREYGILLGTPEAAEFSRRIRDFTELVCEGPALNRASRYGSVVYQAACHLRNVQRVDAQAAQALARIPGLTVRRPADELCCGAGGAYSLFEPELARKMGERKRATLEAAGGDIVVSGNPGCMLHLAALGVNVMHSAELMAESLPTSDETHQSAQRPVVHGGS